jgi:hypothetical protein
LFRAESALTPPASISTRKLLSFNSKRLYQNVCISLRGQLILVSIWNGVGRAVIKESAMPMKHRFENQDMMIFPLKLIAH